MRLPDGALFAIIAVLVVGGPMVLARTGENADRPPTRQGHEDRAAHGGGVGPLQPSPDVPTWAEALERENQTLVDNGPGSAHREAVRRALMSSVRAHRAAPCDARAKAVYLRAVTAYGKARLSSIRGDIAREDLWRTVLDKYLSQAMDQQVQHGFVSAREQGIAELSASPLMGLVARFSPADGFGDPDLETACAISQRGGHIEPLNLTHPDNLPKLRARTDEETYADTHERFLTRLRRDAARPDFCLVPAGTAGRIGDYFYMKGWVEGARVHKEGEAGRAKARSDWDTAGDRQVVAQVRTLIASGRLTRAHYQDIDPGSDLARLFDQTPISSTGPCVPLPPPDR